MKRRFSSKKKKQKSPNKKPHIDSENEEESFDKDVEESNDINLYDYEDDDPLGLWKSTNDGRDEGKDKTLSPSKKHETDIKSQNSKLLTKKISNLLQSQDEESDFPELDNWLDSVKSSKPKKNPANDSAKPESLNIETTTSFPYEEPSNASGSGDEDKTSLKPKKSIKKKNNKFSTEDIDDGNDSEGSFPKKKQKTLPLKKKKLKSHPTATLLKCEKGTSAALEANKDKRVIIVQFGGGTGSDAGDAAVISARKSRKMISIDRGRDNESKKVYQYTKQKQFIQKERKKKEEIDSQTSEFEFDSSDSESDTSDSKKTTGNKDHFIGNITHNHADHIGLELEKEDFDILYHGESDPGKVSKKTKKQKLKKTGEKIFAWRTREGKIKRSSEEQIYLAGKALVPRQENTKDSDENSKSTGALITVDRGTGGKEKTRVFTMLTLGDATPNALAQEVDELIKNDGHPINLVKMAHHGSQDNILTMPPQHTNDDMIVILSGYTKGYDSKAKTFFNRDIPNLNKPIEGVKALLGDDKKEVTKLRNLIKVGGEDAEDELNKKKAEYGYKWKKLYILCQSKQVRDEVKAEASFLTNREDIEIVRDLVISINDDGTVTIEPTNWD
jgi:hypothetical protein